jgi:hypothetical protein
VAAHLHPQEHRDDASRSDWSHPMTEHPAAPTTEASKHCLKWIAFVEKVDDPAGNTIYDELQRIFLPRIEAEARAAARKEVLNEARDRLTKAVAKRDFMSGPLSAASMFAILDSLSTDTREEPGTDG